jgi:prepilin-type N-terminal cleavage/methylation domain-containing protein
MKRAFTMVELAIVLVIIGLILGAVMKGQALINNAKTKRLYSLEQEIKASMLTYFDHFHAYPGDDPDAQTHLGTTDTKNGNGDGQIQPLSTNSIYAPNYHCTDNSKESCALWQHLRLANILTGGNSVATPRNPFGGGVAVGYWKIDNKTTNWIAFNHIPIDVARTLDAQYDDGAPHSGSIRSFKDYNSSTNDNTFLYFEF